MIKIAIMKISRLVLTLSEVPICDSLLNGDAFNQSSIE